MSFQSSVHAKAIELTRLSLEMTASAGSGHPTSAASLAHLATILMYDHMRYDPADPDRRASDRLVLSEGHACPIVYAAAADLGIRIGRNGGRPMTRHDAMRLREIDSEVDGHPNPAEGFPFFPAATGSLGQGLSIAAGLGLAALLDEADTRVFCLIGDGESREGQVWEAVDFIIDQRLNAVCPVFNCNGYGQTGKVSERQSAGALATRLRAAGMVVRQIDGHAPEEIREALELHTRCTEEQGHRPVAIVAETVKGWGSPSLVEKNLHGKPVTGSDLERALIELEQTADRVDAKWAESDLQPAPPRAIPREEPTASRELPSLTEALARFGGEGWEAKKELATRKAYGVALRALGHTDPRVVALDGDVGNSTYSELFANDDALADRFFECRIAEQNMMSTAVGLSKGGYLPFVSTFGKFAIRGYDQLEMAIVSRAPIKLVGSHCGVSLAADGPSQMALPDVAFIHAFSSARDRQGAPLCYLLQPADARAAYALTLAMARHDGPCYLRTLRPDVPLLYDEDTAFELGGHQVVSHGEDLLIVASGYMLHEARKALGGFARHDVRPTLIDLYSLPFDEAPLVEQVRANNGLVLTVEDNYGAGIGSAVSDAVTARAVPCCVRQMHVRRPPKSGRTPDDVLSYLSLSAEDIVRTGMALTQRELR